MKTTVKITVYNGKTQLRNQFTTENYNENECKNFVFNALSNIIEQQNKLKSLGVKNNFFGISEFKENYIDIDIEQGGETSTIAAGITFKFSQLQNVENKKDAFDIIFDTQRYLTTNGVQINQ